VTVPANAKKRKVEPQTFLDLTYHVVLKILHDFVIVPPLSFRRTYGYFKRDRTRRIECLYVNFVIPQRNAVMREYLDEKSDYLTTGKLGLNEMFSIPFRHLRTLGFAQNDERYVSLLIKAFSHFGMRKLRTLHTSEKRYITLERFTQLIQTANVALSTSLLELKCAVGNLTPNFIKIVSKLKNLKVLYIGCASISISLQVLDETCLLYLPKLKLFILHHTPRPNVVSPMDIGSCGMLHCIKNILPSVISMELIGFTIAVDGLNLFGASCLQLKVLRIATSLRSTQSRRFHGINQSNSDRFVAMLRLIRSIPTLITCSLERFCTKLETFCQKNLFFEGLNGFFSPTLQIGLNKGMKRIRSIDGCEDETLFLISVWNYIRKPSQNLRQQVLCGFYSLHFDRQRISESEKKLISEKMPWLQRINGSVTRDTISKTDGIHDDQQVKIVILVAHDDVMDTLTWKKYSRTREHKFFPFPYGMNGLGRPLCPSVTTI